METTKGISPSVQIAAAYVAGVMKGLNVAPYICRDRPLLENSLYVVAVNADGEELASVNVVPTAEHFTRLTVSANPNYAEWGQRLMATLNADVDDVLRRLWFVSSRQDEGPVSVTYTVHEWFNLLLGNLSTFSLSERQKMLELLLEQYGPLTGEDPGQDVTFVLFSSGNITLRPDTNERV